MTPAEILGISPEATEEQAKAAYRKLAQLHHPDRPGGDLEKFQELGLALKTFRRKLLCPVCAGKGFVETRSGLAVKRDRCPKCWSKQ
ncbi:MAG: J domain-containing protein [Actinomycetota bacterium]|nr:J domain-containing protein [Actinomycetota bacterium]